MKDEAKEAIRALCQTTIDNAVAAAKERAELDEEMGDGAFDFGGNQDDAHRAGHEAGEQVGAAALASKVLALLA
jgi:hypothetical protein